MPSRPRLSVLVPVFNTRRFISDCLTSILTQEIDLELIIVDDGSTDNSEQIIDEFCKHEPRARFIQQQHGGVATARNKALELACGDYIAFVDSDDIVPPRTYACLIESAERTNADICTGLIQSFRNERKWINKQVKELFNCVTSGAILNDFPVLARDASPCNKVFSRAFLEKKSLRFPPGISLREDLHFVLRAYAAAARITILPSIIYHYRLRPKDLPPSLTLTFDQKKIRDLLWVINDLKDKLEDQISTEVMTELHRGIIDNIAFRLQRVLQRNEPAAIDLCVEIRIFLKKSDSALLKSDTDLLGHLLLLLIAEGYEQLAIEVAQGGISKLAQKKGLSPVILRASAAIGRSSTTPPNSVARVIRAARGRIKKARLELNQTPQIRQLMRRTAMFGRTANLVRARVRSAVNQRRFRGQEVWVVGERRGQSVEDTGFHFFRYLRKIHPDLPAYFITNENTKGKERLSELGNVLQMGSIEAYEALLAAKVIAYSDCRRDLCAPHPDVGLYLRHDIIGCFLQHGVIGLQQMGGFYQRHNMLARGEIVDLFIASSEREKQFICENLDFPADTIEVTGLSRHDALIQAPVAEKTILVVPTWRQWLRYESDPDSVGRSQYFTAWQNLITDRQLIKLLEKYDSKLQFCPHFAMARHAPLFFSSHPRVEILHPDKIQLQQNLRLASCLVTDYSSTSFELSYLERPVIYYQFDIERFSSIQGTMLFESVEDLPGPLVRTHQAAIAAIASTLSSNFSLANPYRDRIEPLFAHRDDKNCERIYQAIMRRLQ